MKYVYIVIQMKSRAENKYRAFVAKRSKCENVCNLYADYSNANEEVISANVLSKKEAEETAKRWNQDFKNSGILIE